jgi:type I restriction enzyme S subunit
MSHYKPYPAYKDSGVEWIGKVPEGWGVVRIKRTAHIATDRCNVIPSGLTYIGLEDVESGSGQYKPTATTSRQSEDSMVGLFRTGDVLYGKLRPYLRKCITAPTDGACSTEFLVLKLESMSPEWLQNWLLTHEVTQQIEAGCDGAKMPRADWEHVGSIHIPLPDRAEQNAIRAALDRETARIDALISRKTRFIELLKEKRQALITHAVTKGLDPNVKMKDSGVEWIGEVPEGWSVRPIKGIVSTPITDGPHETPQFYGHGVPFVSAEAISGGFLNFEKIRGYISMEAHEAYSKKYKPQKNDIFMIKSGATTGVTAIVDTDIEFNIWSPLAVIRCDDVMDPFFVLNYMRSFSFQEGVSQNWSFGTQQNIGMGVIGNLHVTAPPLAEQRSIATYLKNGTAKIGSLAQKTQRSIDLLKERRSAFITAAVTGQIDLRDAA